MVQARDPSPDARLPGLNEPAPDFTAHTTHGPRSLEQYAGRWLVLFSHPADFTPVCTTEFVAFAQHWQAFQDLDCDLLGLSVDSAYAHIAWVRNIEQHFDLEIPFPIIEDSSMRIARAYGMVQPGESDAAAVRATFVIDPDGMVRAMTYYPMTTGRSVSEILRLVHALRETAEHGSATPESWEPGKPTLMPPPLTVQEANQRPSSSGTDWYLTLKPNDAS